MDDHGSIRDARISREIPASIIPEGLVASRGAGAGSVLAEGYPGSDLPTKSATRIVRGPLHLLPFPPPDKQVDLDQQLTVRTRSTHADLQSTVVQLNAFACAAQRIVNRSKTDPIPSLLCWIEVTNRVHAFVQDANDLDDVGLARAIEDHVHRPPYSVVASLASRVSHVETSDA